MQVRVLIDGCDGLAAFRAGDEVNRDSEFMRKLLVNELAVPLDEEAVAFMAKTEEHPRYASPAYQAIAEELNAEEGE